MNDDVLRSLPVNSDAERAALSCMLKAPDRIIPEALAILNPECFYIPAHRILFQTLIGLFHDQSAGTDLVALNTRLNDAGLMEQVGGPAAVADLLEDVPSVKLFGQYVGLLREKLVLRRVIQECGEVANSAYERHDEAGEVLSDLEGRIAGIRATVESVNGEGPKPWRVTVNSAIETIEERHRAGGVSPGISTGFPELDELTGGLVPGELVVIAARPSVGKTALGLNIAQHVAKEEPVLVFSAEMSNEQLAFRALAAGSRVEQARLAAGRLSQVEISRLTNAIARQSALKLFTDDTSGISVSLIRARTRQAVANHGVRVVVVDYLQLLKGAERSRTREEEVRAMSGELKAMAKDLGVTVLLLAQLSRKNVDAGRRPRCSDLRESGAIEQDADVVVLIHPAEQDEESDPEVIQMIVDCELIIGKARNGRTGTIKAEFHKSRTEFVSRYHGN